MKTGLLAIHLFFSLGLYAQKVNPKQPDELPWIVPIILPSEVLESVDLSIGFPNQIEIEIRDRQNQVRYREIAEKVWRTEQAYFVLAGSTGSPLPKALFFERDVDILLFSNHQLLVHKQLESLQESSVRVTQKTQETTDRLSKSLPGIQKEELINAAAFCSKYLFQQSAATSLNGTSIELVDYGLVINSSGEWSGRGIQANGVVSGKNGESFLMPKGSIICWNGTMEEVEGVWHPQVEGNPDLRWIMCDGTNGTPDLVDRFVLGANIPAQIGDTGGAPQTTLLEENMFGHTHSLPSTSNDQWTHNHIYESDKYRTPGVWLAIIAGGVGWGHWVENRTVSSVTNSGGGHTHSINGNTTYVGSGQAVDIQPPYYSLIYLQSVGSVTPEKPVEHINQVKTQQETEDWVIPITLNRKLIDSLNLVPEQDTWLNLKYTVFPGGPLLHHEAAERVWWIEDVPFLLLGASGTPLPESIVDRATVHIACSLDGSALKPSAFWVFPRSAALIVEPNTGMSYETLMRSLGAVNALYLSETANYNSGNLLSLPMYGSEFFDSNEQKLINSSGDWVGGNVISTGEIIIKDGLDLTVPNGAIVMWNGSLDPSGHPVVNGDSILEWHVCDGSATGIPDLRDRFVVSQGDQYNIGESGGSNTTSLVANSLPSHLHVLDGATVNDGGSHTHKIEDSQIWAGEKATEILGFNVGLDMETHPEVSVQTSDFAGNHAHTSGSTHVVGSAAPIDIRPKYYVLAFIICTGE